MSRPLLVLVDGNFEVNRAFHSQARLTRASDGQPIGAVHGFCRELWWLRQSRDCSHLAVVFDWGKSAKRRAMIEAFNEKHGIEAEEYKGTRTEKDSDLPSQFALCRQATAAFGIPLLQVKGWEADDVIATVAERAYACGYDVEIRASDKDMMQLVRDGIWTYCPVKKKRYGGEEVREKFGVAPHQVVEVQGLMGDRIDNFKGVPGLGPKLASQLVNRYGHIDGILGVEPEDRLVRLVHEHRERALLCRELARLDRTVPISLKMGDLELSSPPAESILAFLREMTFRELTTKIEAALSVPADAEELV